jgi:uncharacterized cupin superfamily protein
MERVNVFSVDTELDPDDPPGYQAPRAKLGPMIGASMIGGSIYELQPGQSVCPYHYEYGNEEWLLVLEGSATLRHPDGEGDRETVLGPGELVCFPQGPQGAHKVGNASAAPVRVLLLSTSIGPSASVYPDSDKIGIWPDGGRDSLIVRRESAVDYYDGEL